MQSYEYAVLGGCLLLSVFLLLGSLLLFSFRRSLASHPGRHLGGVETRHLGWIDLAGVGLVFAIYLGNWIDGGQARETEWVTANLLWSQLLLQFGFVGVVFGVLFRRVNLVDFWGLAPSRAWWVMGVAFLGFVVYSLFLEGMWAIGFEDWAKKTFQRVLPPQEHLEPEPIFPWGLWAIVTVVGAPLIEEVVFRGYLYPVLKRMGGLWLAALTVSLFFAAAHLEGAHLLSRFFLSLLLIAAYEVTGSLWAPFGIHFLNNAFVFSGSFWE